MRQVRAVVRLCAIALACLRGIASSGVASERKEETVGQLRSKADEALISGRAEEALVLLGKVIALEPLSERNLFKRSRVYLRLKKVAAALLDLDGALRLAPMYEVRPRRPSLTRLIK